MLRVGARGSKLALAYAKSVCDALPCDTEVVIILTEGDIKHDVPIHEIGGKGVFCSAIETALLENKIDIAVHSLKDMPGEETPGLIISAVLKRNSPHDVMIGKVFEGCTIGTSSPRRKAQIEQLYKDLNINVKPIRGNVDSRLNKLDNGEYDAIIIAEAGLIAMGIEREWTKISIVPAIGQGIIAVQTRNNDTETNMIVKQIKHKLTYAHAQLERALLKGVGGDCYTKLAAFASGSDPIKLEAVYYD